MLDYMSNPYPKILQSMRPFILVNIFLYETFTYIFEWMQKINSAKKYLLDYTA